MRKNNFVWPRRRPFPVIDDPLFLITGLAAARVPIGGGVRNSGSGHESGPENQSGRFQRVFVDWLVLRHVAGVWRSRLRVWLLCL